MTVGSKKYNVMRCWVLALISTFFSFVAGAQTLTVSASQLNFGTVDELNPDSLPLTILNNMGKTVDVTNIKFYTFYGAPAFSASQNSFVINDGLSQTIWVKFAPLHNIFHNSEMVIENNGQRGAVTVDLLGQGHYSNSYYNVTENKEEQILKTDINTLTGLNYNALLYDRARDSMFMVLDNQKINGQGATVNTLECVYTGRQAIGYFDRTDCQTNDNFNTEHTWPQGLFGSFEPMKSDLHHLFPTDEVANTVRGSYPFGIVTNATWTQGGSEFDNNSNIFEPRNVHKGATARAMLYFVLRYQNYSNFLNSQESILKQWNKTYLPSAVETNRNNTIFLWQNNRNPFVDYPQFADRITSFSSTSAAPVNFSFEKFNAVIDYGTVAVNSPYIYSFNIVNNGNQNIQLSNFSVTNPSILNVVAGGGTVTLAPGESYKTDIQLQSSTASSINEQLTFNTNVPSSTMVTVPITAGVVVIGVEEEMQQSFNVYPLPFYDCFTIQTSMNLTGAEIKLISPEGKNIQYINNSGQICLMENELQDGFYILKITNQQGMSYRQKLVKAGH
jgi:Endonuclease I